MLEPDQLKLLDVAEKVPTPSELSKGITLAPLGVEPNLFVGFKFSCLSVPRYVQDFQ